MIFNSFIALIIITGFSAFIPGACSKDLKSPEVKLIVLNSMERIGQNQQLFGENQASVKAAKNEVESFQVVVGAIQKNVRVTGAEISDLTGEAGIIGKENVSLFREEYARVRRSSSRSQLPPGLFADPLVPFINPLTGVMDPWLLPAFSESDSQFNGGGHLMYPGVPCGIDGPISCMRLKNIRDSMEDWEYFALLEQLAGRDAVTKLVSEVAPDWWASAEDPRVILSTREKIAGEILKLKK